MTRLRISSLLLLSTLIAAPAAMTVPVVWQTAAAADDQRDPNVRTKRTPSMRENVYKQITRVREAAEAERFGDALKILDSLLDSNLNSYEAAMSYNLMAYIQYSRDNYAGAIDAYKKVLSQEALPESLEKSTLYSMGQIQIASERYREGAQTLDRWFAMEEKPSASAYILLGQALFQLKEYDRALQPIETAVSKTRAEGGKVRENWLLLLRAIHYTREDYGALRNVLKQLVAQFPSREYWTQLSAVYGELGDSKKQLSAMQSAYEQGLLRTSNDYRTLGQLLLANDVPYKAAAVLAEGFDKGVIEPDVTSLRMLADAWMLAKEYDKAEDALNRAAQRADDGELYLRLAQIHAEQAEWNEALAAARRAVERGNLKRPDQARMTEGLALYNMDRLDEAKVAFSRASRYEQSEAAARQWTSYIAREQERLAALDRAREAAEKAASQSSG